MTELLYTALQAIIMAAVPLLTAYIVKWLNAQASLILSRIANEQAREYIKAAADAAAVAVAYTSQTYVDTLRASGAFGADAQREAMQRAKNAALSILSASAREYLDRFHGGAEAYIESKIEQEVRAQKN